MNLLGEEQNEMAIVLQYWFMVNFRKDYVTIPVAVGDRRA
jgi:hypothetical protein